MEGSECEAIFDSLKLNPQLFINAVLNSVDELVDDAFDFFHKQASTMLKIEGTDRSDGISKGVAYLQNVVQSVLDKRLSIWKKYCLRHCFAVPEGFSLPKANESAGDSSMDIDILNDRELDAQLDSMRNKLALVEKETADLNREFQALERQSVLSNHCTGSINEALQLYEQHHVHAIFEELTKTALELSKKMEQLNAKSLEQSECIRRERMHIPDGDLFRVNHGNGLFNVALDELQAFITDMKNV
ncbi:protein MIS12 homolog isoform X1 [Actinidia eriantha]|uniref:protein MIS12 homolog isoform X1 n=1 Tax=Actinidia eriantha TaxID=165200 RepID=UPI002587D17C|nr:protein MIS12 homolog isoform X1 [Actinidia eriantha]